MKHILFTLLFIVVFVSVSVAEEASRPVYVIQIDDKIINPIIQEYITSAIQEAEAKNAECLIIELDTPGGLLTSTRTIVKEIMNAHVPIVTYITPSGSRAGSAGVFITLASHIAAMAPSTNIGAAHPVNLEGKGKSISEIVYRIIKYLEHKKDGTEKQGHDDKDIEPEEDSEILSEKILNDTVAWVKTIARNRGRNVEWAEDAVRKSISQTEKEAIDLSIIDIIAQDSNKLLEQINGKSVTLSNGTTKTLNCSPADIHYVKLSTRQKILLAISHPNIAYILMMLGFYGLLFEITHPGIGFPGIAGAMCLILAFVALSTLPINYAGLLLIILGIILFIAELNVVSYGLLTLGGLVSMFLGSLMLIDSPYSLMRVSLEIIFPLVLSTAAIIVFLVGAVIKAHRGKSLVGKEGLIGATGIAESVIDPVGTVTIHGEIWQARSKQPIDKGDTVKIMDVKHLELFVERTRTH
ncbi:MAG: nodulation protein NfeD [Candidatus Omnitrophica bacterium]|nr:nodulation protein NfeD [Candidatus Omnitrophota bacterium]